MGFFVNFTINEQFEESIKSRFRDEFSYNNFSEGEKMRIDLALMLTWRAIAKMRNSINTNLLILDEIFDGSMEMKGNVDTEWLAKNNFVKAGAR
jgi:ABC-type hemin transport system ATPase subunit